MLEDLTPKPPGPEPATLKEAAEAALPSPSAAVNPEPPASNDPAQPTRPAPFNTLESEITPPATGVMFEDEIEEEESAGLSDWKDALRRDFESWLATVTEIPDSETELESRAESDQLAGLDEPDLHSFYEQMAATNAEARKANRRTAEALSLWGDTLGRFDADLAQLREYFRRRSSAIEESKAVPRATCLILVEMLDRARRLALAFESPPPKRRWWNDSAWRRAWDSQRRGFDILVSHLESLLEAEGVARIEALGRPFDPRVMVAVATEPDSQKPHHTVIGEITAGFLHHGELLRPVQVKVTLNSPQK